MTLLLDGLHVSRNAETYLDGISARFERGSLTTVLGRTLAGKTTLMRAIAGLQPVSGGTLTRDGKPFGTLPAWQRDVAMVYQQFINYPHLDVFDNVAFPLRKQKRPPAEIKQRVDAVLATVGLSPFAARLPSALSGGQQQRVALARALVRKADILLLDEPLVNLDYKLREQLREEFRGLLTSQSQGTVIYNTTEPAEAMMLGDRIIVMHEGRILQTGTPAEVFDNPADVVVAGIINDPPMTIFPGRLGGGRVIFDGVVDLPAPARMQDLAPGAYRFGIRATDIEATSESGIPGQVTFSEVSGSETFLHIETGLGEAVMQREGVHHIENNAQIGLAMAPKRMFVFAADGAGQLLRTPEQGAA